MTEPDSQVVFLEKELVFSADSPLVLLNNAHAKELSFAGPERLAHLVREAFLACRIGEADALLIAFDQYADYDSPNFLWFGSRLERFVYVDRIIVAPDCRGQGLARKLYEILFARAREAGHGQVVCEINIDPPNPVSDAFHAGMGFTEIGSAILPGGAKTVRYFSKPL